ncbi:RrF2 family transcriptional regulator [Desulfonatronum thiodismutans]|uniref:RrF2 family transcriptional regulator n=1 Tax=Desulfonatronum thiodismutans TaxID=159290 RepID=UPI0009FE308B|nr:Rrf2 family transcriptional regulator [Desulfonatronum thiodismutans]
MQLSSRTRHGARLLMNLAHFAQKGPLRAAHLSNNIGISVKYLEKIIKPLRQAGLIKGLRGPGGGYFLGRSPEDITLGEIVQALDGGPHLSFCTDPDACSPSDFCGSPAIWADLSSTLQGKLNSITLGGMMRQDSIFKTAPTTRREPKANVLRRDTAQAA